VPGAFEIILEFGHHQQPKLIVEALAATDGHVMPEIEKMTDDSIKWLKEIGAILIDKSIDLQDLAKIIPEQARKFRAYGDYYNFVADEYTRLSSLGVDCDMTQVVDFQSIEDSLSWEVPTTTQLYTTTTIVSGESTSITQPMMPYVDEKPDYDLLQNPPDSFVLLQATDETIIQLDFIKNGLGNSWKKAWDCLIRGDVKNAAVQARTTIDELSWAVPYDRLAKLIWCRFDDKGKPTRASRFAWILHGDSLPAELDNDPCKDNVWKRFGKNYAALQRYVHTSDIKQSDLLTIDLTLKALQEALEEYLNLGIKRLKNNAF